MNVLRQTERKRVISELVTIEGTSEVVNYDFVVPDGVIAEILGVQVTHTSANNTIYVGIQTTDETGNVIIYFAYSVMTSSELLSAPNNAPGNGSNQLGYAREHGEPICVLPGQALTIYWTGNLAAGEYINIKLVYVLKPYSFNKDNTAPI